MTQDKKRILSGIRPTGDLHLGNYLGAIRQFFKYQEESNECFYFVADLHALTTQRHSADISSKTLEIVRGYLACGLDPEMSTIYRQSDIPEIPYMSLLLGMITSESWLRKCTTFKDKSENQEVVSLGLLSYPVLMATDILIVEANLVPVGHDQLQHLEMTRDIALKFNNNFDGNLILPNAIKMEALRIPGLDGSGKMGKSEGNTIGLFEDPAAITKKVKSAVTDSGPEEGKPMSQEMKNLFLLMKEISPEEHYRKYREMYDSLQQKFYGEMKKQLAKDIVKFLEPFREKYHGPDCSPEFAADVLNAGKSKVAPLAQSTFEGVRSKFRLT